MSSLLPSFASAMSVSNVFDVEAMLLDLLERLNYLFWLAAIAVFFWGVIKFIANADDPAEREKGKTMIVWGIISFLVLVSIWGIVSLVLFGTLGISITPFWSAMPYVDSDGGTY